MDQNTGTVNTITSSLEVANLNRKECKMTRLIEEIRSQREQLNELIIRTERIETKMDRVMEIVTRIEDKIVRLAQNPEVKVLLVIMHSSEDPTLYIALRTQMKHKREAIKQCRKHNGNHFEEAFEIISYQNPRNLFHRFKDYIETDASLKASVKFRRTTFQTSLLFDDIKMILFDLEKSFQESINML